MNGQLLWISYERGSSAMSLDEEVERQVFDAGMKIIVREVSLCNFQEG